MKKEISINNKILGRLKKPKLGTIAINESKRRKNLIFIFLFFLLYIILFIFLKDKLLFTPDFGQSDAYHFYLSAKSYLANSLKYNTLPFWTDNLQGGYPLFSEGQIGALFLPNIIFLKFLPFVTGYNLLFIFSLFCLSTGFYLLLKEFKVGSLVAFLFSLIFVFNGSISTRWVHFSLIQSLSLAPFLFYLMISYFNKKKKIYLFLFPIILSQMIFAGHIQAVFISVFGLILWYVLLVKTKINEFKKVFTELVTLMFLIFSGFILALPQILPNIILSQNTVRSLHNSFQTVTAFPLTFKHLISYVEPYIFGNPKFGTYPPFSENWGIFWENTPYLGYIFFIIFLISILLNFKYILKNKFILGIFVLSLFFVLLALGKDSPLYLIFSIFPFNVFRVPSRYLLMVNFLLIFSVSLIFDAFYKKIKIVYLKVILMLLIFFNIFNLIQFAFDYHLFVNKDSVLKSPEILEYKDNSLYLTFNQPENWNQIFLKKGWSKKEDVDIYLFYKNYLYPNSNLLFDQKSFQLNSAGFRLKRNDYLTNLLTQKMSNSIDEKVINLLRVLGITDIITSNKISDNNFLLIKNMKNKNYEITLYKLKNGSSSFFYIPQKLSQINYLADFEIKYDSGHISPEESVIEGKINKDVDNNTKYKILNTSHSNNHYQINGQFEDTTYLVFRVNNYPEWSLKIDNQKVQPLKINLTHIGVQVPKGNHEITLGYENKYFKIGAVISSIYLLLFIVVVAKIYPKEDFV